jgi:chromosomal replication initiator protein
VNAKQIWQTAMERLRPNVSSAVFVTWFQGLTALSYQDGVFVVGVPTTFAKSQMDSRYYELLRPLLVEIIGTDIEMQFVINARPPVPENLGQQIPGETEHRPPKRSSRLGRGRFAAALREKQLGELAATAANSMAPAALQQNGNYSVPVQKSSPPSVPGSSPPGPIMPGLLNPRYTFDTFIVGKSNQLAHAASLAVSENPGRIYNPLFLYGGVGLGKTHLMHAIGHAGELGGLTVLYVTSEKFTNEIINAIRFQKTEEFREKYRQIDILLVDDIQFIAGKESTEEEFFHTFNSLHNANKQIVVTSDRPPKAINSLQDRLRSRFEWGLLADIQPPEYEHRLAILRSKCESLRFTVPPSVIEFISRPPCNNVRELEGALNRVIAYATLHDAPLTVHLAAQALQHIYDTKPPITSTLSLNDVLNGVCSYYHVSIELLRGKQRDRDIAWPRQVAMYLMREQTTASLLQIGTALGGRDHTTIMYGWEKVNNEIKSNEQTKREVTDLIDLLHNPTII